MPLQGELDGSGQLTIEWTDRAPPANADANRRVEELLWLTVAPAGVELDAKYLLPDGVDWPETLTLLASDRWEFLPDDNGELIAEVDRLPDGRQLIYVQLPSPDRSRRAVRFRFRLRATSPWGRLRAPAIELATIPVANRSLAVSCDPTLECEPSAEAAATARAVADFLTTWGDGASPVSPPLLVLATDQRDLAWSLSVRPRPAESSSDERLLIVAGAEQLRLQYQADVEPQAAHCFRWSLTVPTDL